MSQVEYDPLADYYELCNSSVNYDAQAFLVAEAWERYGNPKPPRVLDVACGPGLLSRRLLSQGMTVVGIDLSPHLLVQAAREPGLRVAQADMRRLPFRGAFDIATCLLHTINYMTDDDDLRAALAALRDAVEPGGLVLLDFLAYEPRSEWNSQWSETVTGDGVTIVCRHHQTANWGTMVATDRHTYTVRDGDRVWSVSGEDLLRITSPREMRLFAADVGLEVLQVTGKYALDKGLGWDGGVLVARRPRPPGGTFR
jgi:SAM-dependent methyltransferase